MQLVTPGELPPDFDFLPEHTLLFRHKIHYSTKDPVPAAEVAQALLALDRIVQRIPAAMRLAVPGTPKTTIKLYVEDLETGSLTEEVIVALGFGSKEEMVQTLAMWRDKWGINLNTSSGLFRAFLLGLTVFGAYHAVKWGVGAFMPTDEQKAQVEISHNTIIQIGAGELNMTPEKFTAILRAVPHQNRNAADAVKFIAPAKRDPKAAIVFDESSTVQFPSEFVAAVPTDFEPPDREDSEVLENVVVQLRAGDRDSNSRGWAAVVPSVSAWRLKLELGEGISPAELYSKDSVTGEVEVFLRPNKKGVMVPHSYRLISVDKPKADSSIPIAVISSE